MKKNLLKKSALLAELFEFLSKTVSPNTERFEQNHIIIADIFSEFKKKKFFSIYVPGQYGGIDLTQKEKIDFQEMMGYHGGALSFLQAQTGTASWLLQIGDNSSLREEILPEITKGKIAVG